MNNIIIGQASTGTTFTLPTEAVTETFAILAKRGVGKTYTASVLTEELLKAGLHVCVADPIGVWWGLRASADGKSAGLPIIVLGGDHGDVPLEVSAGEVIANLVAEEGLSVVLDLSRFRKGEQTRFMTDFCERLYHKNRQPLHLVLDEADAFAPQRPMKGQERLLGAVEDLVRRGRARGLGVTLVTQRAAVLNKDVLTQAEVLVTLRTIAPQDREAIDAWIKVHGTPEQREELMSSLPSLPIGTAWFWSPGWLDVFARVQVRRRETFDSSATPKVGAKIQAPKRLADVDIVKLRDRLAATIERVKADDPRELRKQIAELKTQLQKRVPETKTELKIERVEVPVLQNGQIKHLEQAISSMAEVGNQLVAIAQELGATLAKVNNLQPTPNRASLSVESPKDRIDAKPSPRPIVPVVASLQLRAGERRMLETLARRHPMKVTRAQLGTLARFTASGGTFGAYFGTLRRAGLIEENSGEIQITQAGLDFLGHAPSVPQTTEEILAMWRSALRAGERKMLDELVSIYPASLSREELGAQTGFTVSGGTFGAYLGTLRRNGLVEASGDRIKASDTLFLIEAQ